MAFGAGGGKKTSFLTREDLVASLIAEGVKWGRGRKPRRDYSDLPGGWSRNKRDAQ